MSVASETSSVEYTLSAASATLTVPFYFMSDTDLVVTRTRSSVVTTLVLDSDYTVTGTGDESGGSITVTGQASGDVIDIVRTVPLTQEHDFVPLTKLSETHIEAGLDKCTMMAQQLRRDLDVLSSATIEEAPIDGTSYARKDAGWVALTGGGDMLKSVYDTDNDGKVDAAEVADSATYATTAGSASTATTAGTISGSITIAQVTNLTTDLAAKAPLASPALTGTPTAPTASTGTNTTQVATTAFVATAVAAEEAARETLEDNLTAEISAELENRVTADTTLQSNITAEATTRSNADATIQGNLVNEAATRAAADELALKIANNLSDLNNAATARTNLGLGTAATTNATAYATAAQGATADSTASTLAAHLTDTANPHAVTAAQVGLGSVDNTSDLEKPLSTAALAALALKAALVHTHAMGELVGLSAALDAKADAAALSAEVSARDAAIASALSAEVAARDGAIASAIAAEASARDTSLSAAIAAESDARDQAILSAISAAQRAGRIVADTSAALTLSDAGTSLCFTASSAVTLTIPASSAAAFAARDTVEIVQEGEGQVTIAAASGVTLLNTAATSKSAGRGAILALRRSAAAADTWILTGDRAAS